VVTIPNGDLSARQIENYAARDRFLFNPVIAIAYGNSSAKLKEAIFIVQQVLAEEKNMAEGHRARLGSISERAFNIEVFSHIDVHEFDTQVIIREKLLLTIFERLEAADISLAFPTQTIVFSPSQLEAVRGGAAANGDAADADQTAKAATPALPALPAPPVVWTDATPPPRT
jgi:MscS family membrane protein